MKRLLSPVSGMLREYRVDVGAAVAPDTEVALVESMKMEITTRHRRDLTI